MAEQPKERIVEPPQLPDALAAAPPPPAPPPPPAEFERSTQFYSQARSVIAQHGIGTPRSMVLLKALQQEHEMTDADFDAAIERIKESSNVDDSERKNRERFTEYVAAELQRLQGRTLTGNVSAAMVRYGVEHYLLPKRTAKQILSEEVQRAKIQYVSPEVARDIIRDRIEQIYDEHDRVGSAARAELVQQGRQLGLQEYEVDAIIRKGLGQDTVSRWQFAGLMGAGLVIGVGVIAFFVWMLFLRPTLAERLEKEIPEKPDPVVAGNSANEPERVVEERGWWEEHDNLRLAVMSAERSFEWYKPLRDELFTNDGKRRSKAYKKLIKHHDEASVDKKDRQLYRRLVTQFAVHEPNDELVEKMAELVHGHLPATDAKLLKDANGYDGSFRVLEMSVVLLQDKDLSQPRQAMWRNGLAEALGIPLAQDLPGKEILQACRSVLAQRIYQLLIASAKDDAEGSFPVYQRFERPIFLIHIDKPTRESLVTKYLVVVLPSAGRDWDKYRRLIQESIFSQDSTNALALVDILEQISDKDLQHEVAGLLLTKVKADGATSLKEVIQVVREGLGVQKSKSIGNRWSMFEQSAQSTLNSKQPDNVTELLRLSTLGAALSKANIGADQFDELWDKPPVKINVPAPNAVAPSKPKLKAKPLRSDVRNLSELIRRLEKPARIRTAAARTKILRSIVDHVSKVPELNYDQAKVMANYIMVYKRQSEDHESVIRWVDELGKWRGIKLAMVDRFRDSSTFNIKQMEEVLRAMLGRGVSYKKNTESNRRAARLALLKSVADNLYSEKKKSRNLDYLDEVAAECFEMYQLQARLLGVSETARNASSTPSDLLGALIRKKAKELGERTLSPESKQELSQINSHFKVADYLAGGSDLAETVYLQRLWVRLLALDVGVRHAEMVPEAGKIVMDLNESDRMATDLIGQFASGEAAIVQMWLLQNSPK